MLLYIVLSILVIVIALIVSIYVVGNNKFAIKSIKIKEAEEEIEILLNQKLDLMQKINKAIKKKTKEDYLEDIDSINSEELSSFELSKKLSIYDKPLVELIDYNKDIKLTEKEEKTLDELSSTNVSCKSTQKFYNDNVEIYNKLIHTFPYRLSAKIKHYKEKELFEDEKEEIFEILKQ